jgi:hypothetical protein
MPFEINLCANESCDSLKLVDATGFFGLDRPFGYNGPGVSIPTLDPDGTFGYAVYSVDMFFATDGGFDANGTPNYTADLLTFPHTVDPVTGEVTWEFSLDELGVTALRSGWWLFRITATWVNGSTYDYSHDEITGFTGDMTSIMDQTMKKAYASKGLGCDCSCGGTKLSTLYMKYRIWRDLMGCAGLDNQFQSEGDYLYRHLPLCQC